MSTSYSAMQFESSYKPTSLCNWEVPKVTEPKGASGRKMDFLVDDNGHLLPSVPKVNNSFGDAQPDTLRWPKSPLHKKPPVATMGYKGISTSYLPTTTIHLTNAVMCSFMCISNYLHGHLPKCVKQKSQESPTTNIRYELRLWKTKAHLPMARINSTHAGMHSAESFRHCVRHDMQTVSIIDAGDQTSEKYDYERIYSFIRMSSYQNVNHHAI
eukprot:6212791-Pleurochrysis_carterae.AAC.2